MWYNPNTCTPNTLSSTVIHIQLLSVEWALGTVYSAWNPTPAIPTLPDSCWPWKNGYSQGEPGLAGIYWGKGWWKFVVTAAAIGRAKLQSNHHYQQTNTKSFTGQMPSPSPNQQCQSIEGKISHPMDLLTPNSSGGLPTLSLATNSSWLPWGVLPCLSSPVRCQYPLVAPVWWMLLITG